jgi:endonuclease YncB( thermonuclease family)
MRRVLPVLLLLALPGWAATSEWEVLTRCHLIANLANDGDSFHVKHKNREYIFRLYFVDCPETEDNIAGRVEEQAQYFGITKANALQIGAAAARFTNGRLKNSFTVITRWQDAKGRSQLPRHFAFVRMGDKDLAEELVEQGYARIYGATADPPGELTANYRVARLRELERAAKTARRGAWAFAVGAASSQQPVAKLPPLPVPSAPATNSAAATEVQYRISARGVRHNSSCRYFNAETMRPCGATEGRPCKVCGG